MTPLLTIDDLAAILRCSPGSLRNRRSKAPDTLPPAIKPPGSKTTLWRREVVEAWLDEHVERTDEDHR